MSDKQSTVPTREDALRKLLEPIQWGWSSSVRARQNYVCQRHAEVRAAYPFLMPEERAKADAWRKAEAHSELWD